MLDASLTARPTPSPSLHSGHFWVEPRRFTTYQARLGGEETELRTELRRRLVLYRISRRAPAGGHITQEGVSERKAEGG